MVLAWVLRVVVPILLSIPTALHWVILRVEMKGLAIHLSLEPLLIPTQRQEQFFLLAHILKIHLLIMRQLILHISKI